MVNVSILSSYEALKKSWNFQPSFQRQTKPSKALASALKVSAHNEALVIPVILRNHTYVTLSSGGDWSADLPHSARVEGSSSIESSALHVAQQFHAMSDADKLEAMNEQQ
jgi:hypothetical protein